MHEYKEGKVTSPIYSLGEDRSRLVTIGLIVGAAAMAGAFFTALDIKRFFHAYLISFCFFASISTRFAVFCHGATPDPRGLECHRASRGRNPGRLHLADGPAVYSHSGNRVHGR